MASICQFHSESDIFNGRKEVAEYLDISLTTVSYRIKRQVPGYEYAQI